MNELWHIVDILAWSCCQLVGNLHQPLQCCNLGRPSVSPVVSHTWWTWHLTQWWLAASFTSFRLGFLMLSVFVSCIHVKPFSQGHFWPHGIGLGGHSFYRLVWPAGKQANNDGIRQRQYHCTQRCLAFPHHVDGCIRCIMLCGVASDFSWFLALKEE